MYRQSRFYELSDVHSDRTEHRNGKMAIRLMRRLKNIFERELEIIFQNKETIIEQRLSLKEN